MDSRQQSIHYLMIETSELARVCANGLMAIGKKKMEADIRIEAQLAIALSSIKEATYCLNFDEERLMNACEEESQRRSSEI